MVDEFVVISGKGGTGKTSIAASFAVLAESAVVADCDVDAADLHLVLEPETQVRHPFVAGHEAVIVQEACTQCGACYESCRYDAIKIGQAPGGNVTFTVDPIYCEGCGVCAYFCPEKAIDFPEQLCGNWMVSDTRCGPMVHARLGVAAENSGKLVTMVRQEAHRIAERDGRSLVIIDGPPGIGCPVIASLTGTTGALIVTEPTVSGEHDLKRILALTRHFGVTAFVCVNKWDLNPEMTRQIEQTAEDVGVRAVGRIRYDSSITRAQIDEKAVVETDAAAAEDVRNVWEQLGLGNSKSQAERPVQPKTTEDSGANRNRQITRPTDIGEE